MIHDIASAVEGGAVSDAVAFVLLRAAMIGIESVEYPDRLLLGVVHRPCPEASVAIDLAVVEANVGTILFGVEQAREGELVTNLDRVKSAIGPGDKAAPVARGDRPDAHRGRPFAKSPVVDAEKTMALDVEPVE
jgi:hypothetical protein